MSVTRWINKLWYYGGLKGGSAKDVSFGTSECYLTWKKIFEAIIRDLEKRSFPIRVGTKSNDTVYIRDRREERNRGKDHVKKEAEIRVRWLQAKEYLQPPETERSKERFIP